MDVKLMSSDGHELVVEREHALTSGTIKATLHGLSQSAEVNFRESPSCVLSKVHVGGLVHVYFTYKAHYTNSFMEMPKFPTASEIVLEPLVAANL
ncbi:elongin-C-like [Ursus americanus]|uniref:elongin-C-like n=1 Tax=Ursus americanus TaxID=9643 RepID=UPI001E67AA1E|nr:elongin-C-like [Ursus americanus]